MPKYNNLNDLTNHEQITAIQRISDFYLNIIGTSDYVEANLISGMISGSKGLAMHSAKSVQKLIDKVFMPGEEFSVISETLKQPEYEISYIGDYKNCDGTKTIEIDEFSEDIIFISTINATTKDGRSIISRDSVSNFGLISKIEFKKSLDSEHNCKSSIHFSAINYNSPTIRAEIYINGEKLVDDVQTKNSMVKTEYNSEEGLKVSYYSQETDLQTLTDQDFFELFVLETNFFNHDEL